MGKDKEDLCEASLAYRLKMLEAQVDEFQSLEDRMEDIQLALEEMARVFDAKLRAVDLLLESPRMIDILYTDRMKQDFEKDKEQFMSEVRAEMKERFGG